MNSLSPATLAFDVYGTLIDTQGVVSTLEKYIGSEASAFSQTWRNKQLEYSFRRGLMRQYKDFSVCTVDAFEYTCRFYNVELTGQQKQHILGSYQDLPAFGDVSGGLEQARDAGFKLYAFSNGKAQAVESLLKQAGLQNYFLDIVSVDEVRSFKPDPAVYKHFLERVGATAADVWLVSSNPFDVIGAMASGMKGAWVRRSAQTVFDTWGIEPTVTVSDLAALPRVIAEENRELIQ